MLSQLLACIKKEILLLIRDIGGLVILFIMPLILVITVTKIQKSTYDSFAEASIPVLFIDHNNYQEICEYKERIRVYAMEHPETEIVLRYPLFNMVERLDFQKKTNRNLNQFTV